jgi:hypothetical protein
MDSKYIIRNGVLEQIPEWCENIEGEFRAATDAEIEAYQQKMQLIAWREPTAEQQRQAAMPKPLEFMEAMIAERRGDSSLMEKIMKTVDELDKLYPKPEEKAPEKKPKK